MFESRCGVCYSKCEKKEAVKCTGCPSMKQPFWGAPRGVKSCCENKGLNHCGECAEFPCQMCADMGKDMGFDPKPRPEQCLKWKTDKNYRGTNNTSFGFDNNIS